MEINKPNLSRLVRADEIMNNIEPDEWIISDVLPKEGILELFGASGSYKSFVLLDMLFCIAIERRWCNKTVRKGKVIYVAGEGIKGVRKRLKALSIRYGVNNFPDFYVLQQPIDLSSKVSLEQLALDIKESVGRADVIVFDTLHANSTGDEDRADDFAIVNQNLKESLMKKDLASLVGWVHHIGHEQNENKNTRKRSRGTSSRYAALDVSILVEKIDNLKAKISCTKMKDANEFKEILYDFEVVNIGNGINSLAPKKEELAWA